MIEVIVRGPGLCINCEAEIIRRALTAYGCKVVVENDHPIDDDNIAAALQCFENAPISKLPIKLKVDHLPWGG